MNLSIDSLKTSEQEITGYYLECHGPCSRCKDEINVWVIKMIDMLGLDDCQFIIRSRSTHTYGLWMTKGTYLFDRNIRNVQKYSWGEAAVKITNNSKLEAVRIVNPNEAIDSKGFSICLNPAPVPIIDSISHVWGQAPALKHPIVEGPSPMPEYQGRWEINYEDNYGSGGKIAQNGEQLPDHPCDEQLPGPCDE